MSGFIDNTITEEQGDVNTSLTKMAEKEVSTIPLEMKSIMVTVGQNGISEETPSTCDSEPVLTETEQKMLSALREIASKCCHGNPAKRPTADEILDILKAF